MGLELGTGTRSVVLVHELGGGGLCGWLPYGRYLAAHGIHVLLYDTRCTGASRRMPSCWTSSASSSSKS